MIHALFFFSIIVLSQAATLIRFAEASSLAICFWRLFISAVLLLPFLRAERGFSSFRTLNREERIQLAFSGFFLFAHFYFFFRSVQETSIANSTIIFSLNPVTTAIGAWILFRERVTLHLGLACALGFAGIAVLFGERAWSDNVATGTTLLGDLWGIVSAIFFTGYILTGKRVRQKISNFPYAFAIYLQTAAYAAIAMLAIDTPFVGYSSLTWWMFLALAVFPTLLGHAIFTHCLNFLNVNFMSCMTLVEPVFAAIVAWYLFREPLTEFAAIGFALTCAAVLVLYAPHFGRLLKRGKA